MSDARWIDVDLDVRDAIGHFQKAGEIHRTAPFEDQGLPGYIAAMALMHAMQAGYTSLEAALLRVLDILGEDRPSGATWHQDLTRRAGTTLDGERARPAILMPDVHRDVEEVRRFRHPAMHGYGGFNAPLATPAIDAAGRLAASFPAAITGFRSRLDPS